MYQNRKDTKMEAIKKLKCGTSNFLSLAVISVWLMVVMFFSMALYQYVYGMNILNNTCAVVARAVALSTTEDEAERFGLNVAESAIDNANIRNLAVDIDYAGTSSAWEKGSYVTVTLSADIDTFSLAPVGSSFSFAGRKSRSTLVVLEHESTPTLGAGATEQDIWNWLIAMGYTASGAAGIMGNLYTESNFNPSAVSPSGYRGLVQWSSSRWANLESYCATMGLDPLSIAGQMTFMDYELQQPSYNILYSYLQDPANTNPSDAAMEMAAVYERCTGTAGEEAIYDPSGTALMPEQRGVYYQGLRTRINKACEYYVLFR